MPAVSKKQERFMQAVAHSPKFAKKVGVPQSVGREFTKKEGGEVKKESKAMAKKEIAFMQKKGAPKSMIKHEKAEYGMKKGGKAYQSGGMTPNQFLKTMGQKLQMARGTASDNPIDFSKATPASMGKGPINPSAMKQTRARAAGRMTGMKSGGLAAGHKAADGIAKKGKTRAMQVKMMGGGKC